MSGYWRSCLAVLAALSLSACATLPRTSYGFDGHYQAEPVGFSGVRVDSTDEVQSTRFEADIRRRLPQSPDHRFNVLALSGGGAQGAYGAGLLVGWTRSGVRPQFQIVTGASTGALIAPMAFLGPDWDPQLRAAFTSGVAADLLRNRGLFTLFSVGLYSPDRLRALVEEFVSPQMVEAVAREARTGRTLLIATTDLDTQRTVLWDMGKIAAVGGRRGRTMFIDILVASASVPGVFPPVMIPVADRDGAPHEEMHADGGTSQPFFTVPESLLLYTDPDGAARKSSVYLVLNSQVSPSFMLTKHNTLSIVGRGFDTMLKATTRTALTATEAFCLRNGLDYHVASVPEDVPGSGFLDFSTKTMRALFDRGLADGASGQGWRGTLYKPAKR